MILLGVETSTLQGSVAVGRLVADPQKIRIEVLFSKKWLRQRSHGELLTASIEEALKYSDITFENLNGFCLSIGPGSFTGIRVGMTAVKTLGYALEKPIYSFSSLDTLAQQVPPERKSLLTLVNAHKSQVYAAKFTATKNKWKQVMKPSALTPDLLEKHIRTKILCVGDGYSALVEKLSKGLKSRLVRDSNLKDHPEAETLVRHALQNLDSVKPVSWKSIEALYIRGSEAEEKLKSGTLKPLPEF